MPEMNPLLKKHTDAMWEEALSKVGRIERMALNRRREMIYSLIQKHFDHDYALLDHLEKRLFNAPEGGAE